MKRICLLCLLAVLCLAACSRENTAEQSTTEHVHVPDGADCQSALMCADCGEVLAERGEHDYPDEPNAEQDGFLYYVCRVCGKIKIVNEDGAPVVPVG